MKLLKLEFIRSFASIYIFILHLGLLNIQELSNFVIKLLLFAPEAVTAFFLLSGFVINYSYMNKKEEFRVYFIKRFRRIYPLFILGFILAVACMFLSFQNFNITFKTILGHLFMLQNTGNIFEGVLIDCIPNNPPFWSLSYEWWYYMLFIPTFALGIRSRIPSILIAFINFSHCNHRLLYRT